MSKKGLLSTAPPQPAELTDPQATVKNPYRKWHIAVCIPPTVLAVVAGILGLQVVEKGPSWIFGAGFLLFIGTQFVEHTISDKLLAGVYRPSRPRFFDAFITAMWLLTSLLAPALFDQWAEIPGLLNHGMMIGIYLVYVLAIGVLVHETGSVGRVVNPKTLDEMDTEVREVVERD